MHGAFVLGAPGTFVRQTTDALTIGNQPGCFHYGVVAGCLPIGCATLWLLWPYQPIVALTFFTLFGIAPVLILFNRQRFEIRPRRLSLRGRALGKHIVRNWCVSPSSAVRLWSYQEFSDESTSHWTHYQAQLLTHEGWIGIAESAQREVAEQFCVSLAEAARVPYDGCAASALPMPARRPAPRA